jgi:PQQ-dependent dehydrogenase (s-GDH family)
MSDSEISPSSYILNYFPIINSGWAQTEGNSSVPSNQTLKAESTDQKRLPSQEGFTTTLLATNFTAPHNLLYGPDNALWITERLGKNITRVDAESGEKLNSIPVPNVLASGGQDGLMGMAFDPDFNNTNYIYVAYTYDAAPSEDELDRLTKITRFTYDPSNYTLTQPVDLINGLAGSIDHNSGRMTFGTDGKLYYTIGDQGKNQISLYCSNIEAQHLPTSQQVAAKNWDAYEGKVLRMNPDGSIPEDNPVIEGVQSHIYTYGHRNPQGIAVGPIGDLFVAEHGDKSDDEINHLIAGGNYGWPFIAGYKDNKAYQYVNWSAAENCESLEWDNIASPPAGLPVTNESDFDATNFIPPVQTFYTVENGFNFTDPACGGNDYVCWPTVAPSSVRLYTVDSIPGWSNTLLMTTLKAGKIFHVDLNDNGTAVANDPESLFHSENRYRDITFSPDGSTIYVITDSFGPAQALNGSGVADDLWNPGSLLMFRYGDAT